MVESATALIGMAAISAYLSRSESTVLAMKKAHPKLPMKKIGGIWESDAELLDEWKRMLIMDDESTDTVEPKKRVNRKD